MRKHPEQKQKFSYYVDNEELKKRYGLNYNYEVIERDKMQLDFYYKMMKQEK